MVGNPMSYGEIDHGKFSLIKPRYFLSTVAGNVNNKNLSDADFRSLLRRTLPIVDWPDREEYKKKFEEDAKK